VKLYPTLLATLFLSAFAAAQPVGVGIKVGSTLNNSFHSISTLTPPSDHHIIAGPYVDIRLPFHFGVEADALYDSNIFNFSSFVSASSWTFPVMAKYRIGGGIVRPYVEGGPVFSRISDITELPVLNHRSNYGIALGAGLEFKFLVLRISPEVRFYGYALKNIVDPNQFESNRSQASFLVGFGF
jgi:hypothetical protein